MELEAYYPQIRRYVARFSRDSWDADDLAQETYCRAYQWLADGNAHPNLKAWLFVIARRAAIDLYRRRPQAKAIDQYSPPVYEETPRIERNEELLPLSRAFRSLDQGDRKLLRDYYAKGRSCAELGPVSRGYNKLRLYRARKKLLAQLE